MTYYFVLTDLIEKCINRTSIYHRHSAHSDERKPSGESKRVRESEEKHSREVRGGEGGVISPALTAMVMMHLGNLKLLDTRGNRQQVEIDLVGTMSSQPHEKQLKSHRQNALTLLTR